MYDVPRKGVVFSLKNGNPNTVRFISPFRSGYPEVDQARALYYEPPHAERALVFVHGLGRVGINHLTYYPKKLSRHGVAAIMPIMPFHEERVSPGHEHAHKFVSGPSEVMEKKFSQAVTDVLTCVDYLEQRGHTSCDIMGISSGGMIATIAMALDRRIKKGVLVITGGNLEIISWKSVSTRIYRTWRGSERKNQLQRSHRIRLEFEECVKSFTSLSDLKNVPGFFRYDPSLFAKLIGSECVLMFSASVDIFIPREASDDLWQRLGKPKRYFLPCGHLGAHIFFKRLILKKSLEFFTGGEILAEKETRPVEEG
jgi:dienelactone hydrolase